MARDKPRKGPSFSGFPPENSRAKEVDQLKGGHKFRHPIIIISRDLPPPGTLAGALSVPVEAMPTERPGDGTVHRTPLVRTPTSGT